MLTVKLLIILISLVISICVYHLRRRKLYVLSKKLTGPKSYPIIGSAYHFFGLETNEIVDKLTELAKIGTSPSKFWFGQNLLLAFKKPEHMQIALNSNNCLEKEDLYHAMIDIDSACSGKNYGPIFRSTTEVWKVHRKIINPSFSSNVLKTFVPIISKASKLMIENLKTELNKGAFDLYQNAICCTLDMICSTLMGVEMDVQKNKDTTYINAQTKMFEVVSQRMFNLLLRSSMLFRFSKWYKVRQELQPKIHNFVSTILKKRRNRFIDSNEPDIFINRLFKAKNNGLFSEADIFAQTSSMLAAGNDTIASTISFVILMLAMHPDIQDKVYQEINEMFPTKNFDIDYNDLSSMEYSELVIKETVRLFPGGPFIARKVTSEMIIDDLVIPAGVSLFFSIYNLHRDPEIWGQQSEMFNPDNFLPENVLLRHPYSFLGFSAGPRNCIGFRQAMMSLKIMLAYLLKNYKFSTDLKMEELRLQLDVTLNLTNKHMVSIQER